ncbi:MAG: Ribose-phosphate pyrophosphokinase [Methanosaeta sp. PtaB.Bin039]|nr:MAG: Ribose-phosphate pyrophosphokinase [Methanosaeta sp. PtaB.Bin039]OPY44113.1 MAG: Ribose-phosphate pyrophosphokinase [Methanosaeta sp. PtaU1.Bin028]HOT06063.1 ribose-phosphate diphosphokinase [Methanotrichaceae archaeon]HQF16287.1 ribose-phosphate diphosphokinase [Methanotrichaceae archaeon]HQI90059.1 ribose-phosphate diphosphokinase [Methanotrichaceae archaeon]
MIIGGPSSQLLAGRVAALRGEELAICDFRNFPDGEAYAQIQSELAEPLLLIQSTPTDRDFIYLLQLLDVLRGRRLSLVIPYFGYARQDKVFQPGEPMTARALATALNPFLQGDRAFTINIHAPTILGHFSCQAQNLDATPLLAERIKSLDLADPVIISPDKGAVTMASRAASLVGCPFDHLEKTRHSGTEVSMAPREIAVKGRDIVITDDMIATGGTMATAISLLRRQGARRVYLAAVHAVLTGSAILKLCRAGVEAIIATDTLDRGVSSVSVAPLIADATRRD